MLVNESTTVKEEVLAKEDNEESLNEDEWRQQSIRQIDSIARVFCWMGILAILGIIWAFVDSFFLFDGIERLVDGIGIYIIMTIVLAATGAVLAQRVIQKNMAPPNDQGDCKQCKKKREEEDRRRLQALFLLFVAMLSTLQLILTSMNTNASAKFEAVNFDIYTTMKVPSVSFPV